MTAQLTVAEAASRYAAAGWPVHPLHDTAAGHCSCAAGPNCQQAGKHPRTAHGFYDGTTDTKTVTAWWRRWPQANIGIPTGRRSGLVVIDLDGPAGATTWHSLTAEHGDTITAVAATPHGGHHWYRLPDGLHVPRSIRGLGDGIDVLGDDGYAIAPPSTITARCSKPHSPDESCSSSYAWTSTARCLARLPVWISERLEILDRVDERPRDRNADESISRTGRGCARTHSAATRTRGGVQVKHPRRYALAALRGEADRVAKAAPGQRNDLLNYAAWRLADHVAAGTLTEAEVRAVLARAATACGLVTDDGPRVVHNTITSALRSGGRTR